MVRNRFSERNPVVVDCSSDPGRTKQSMKKDCDINLLMAKYLRTGQIDHFATHGASYGDFSPVDFHEAMNVVAKADEMFAALPSSTRKRFGNDPAEFLSFVQDDKNLEEMRKLGLAKPVEVKAPVVENGPAPTT